MCCNFSAPVLYEGGFLHHCSSAVVDYYAVLSTVYLHQKTAAPAIWKIDKVWFTSVKSRGTSSNTACLYGVLSAYKNGYGKLSSIEIFKH